MSLKEQLSADLKSAMKNARTEEMGVLRMALSAIHNKEIEKKGMVLDDEATQAVLMGEAKKRKEAALAFENGGRPELAAKELSELALLQKYLPQELTSDKVEQEVARILGAGTISEFGPAMKAAMTVLRGRADANFVQAAVKKFLAGGHESR